MFISLLNNHKNYYNEPKILLKNLKIPLEYSICINLFSLKCQCHYLYSKE
jgi:hypothetical protein